MEPECGVEKFSHLTIEDLIDVAVTPNSINTKFLHTILYLFSVKLKLGNISIEAEDNDVITAKAKHYTYRQPKIFKILHDGQLEIQKKQTKQRKSFLLGIRRTDLNSDCKFVLPRPETIEDPQTNRIPMDEYEKRLLALEKQLNPLVMEFKEYEKCQKVNRQVETNTDDICRLRCQQSSMSVEIEHQDDQLRCIQTRIEEIESRALQLKQLPDIIQQIYGLFEWKNGVNREFRLNVERFQLLKAVKADKYQVNKIQELKADRQDLLLFTTLDQFKSIQNDLYSKVSELHEKMCKNEKLWTKANQSLKTDLQRKVEHDDLGVINVALHKELHIVRRKLDKLITDLKQQQALHENFLARSMNVCKSPLALTICLPRLEGDIKTKQKLK